MDHSPRPRAVAASSAAPRFSLRSGLKSGLTLALPLALAAVAASAPQSAEIVELVGPSGSQAYSDAAGDWDAYNYSRPVMGRSGGWCTAVESLSPVNGSPTYFAVGRLASDPDGAARILRTPKTIGGFVQQDVYPVALDGSSMVYLASEAPWMVGATSLWHDDQQILTQGTPIAGGTAEFYFGASVRTRPDGSMLILGVLREPGTVVNSRALVEWPSMNVLLQDGDSMPGVPAPITLASSFSASVDGSHWAMLAHFLSPGTFYSRDLIVVDGDVYEPEPGYPAIWNEPVSPRLASLGVAQTWDDFFQPQVLNDGTVAFYARGGVYQTISYWSYYVRNGTVAEIADPLYGHQQVVGLDPTGAILSFGYPDQIPRIEGIPVMRSFPSVPMDIDLDGIADAGYLAFPQVIDLYGEPTASGETIFRTVTEGPNGPTGFALVRARNFRLDSAYCNGVPNSTGYGASMLATGDRRTGFNEVTLRAYGLPLQSFGYFLASQTQGFDPNPGGSEGHLCLSGEIGRLLGQVFQSGTSGTSGATLDLTAMPQPMGAVSVLAGQTWNFQAWYRDQIQGSATSNFTDAIAVDFE